jgi:anti-sigma28 factor (negative regulator of flagellin synthesis)
MFILRDPPIAVLRKTTTKRTTDMSETNEQKPPRRKGITSLTLQWIAEKLRRTTKIKEELSNGTYQVDSSKVAKAIVTNNHGESARE